MTETGSIFLIGPKCGAECLIHGIQAGWQDSGVRKKTVRFVYLVCSSDAISTVLLLLSGDFRCHGEELRVSPRPGIPGRGLG